MAGKKRILVVDDYFEMLEFLRSMLELSNSDYEVMAAPSAEEGLLELRRMATSRASVQRGAIVEQPIDLLITDVRLPGMSGFDLVRKVRDLRPELPVLMITAYASAQGRQEANNLGVYRYFEKPLDTDALLAAVHATLTSDDSQAAEQPATRESVPAAANGVHATARESARSQYGSASREQAETPEEATTEQAVVEETAAHAEIRARLEALLSDTGAVQALLADEEGAVLFRAGTGGNDAVERLARLLARSVADSFELAAELQSAEPFTIQYQAGERADLYTANIGRHYFLSLLFDAQARRGRIGTVWVFAQRAIKALRELLPVAGEGAEDKVSPGAGEQASLRDVQAAHDNVPTGQESVKAEASESTRLEREQQVQPVRGAEKVNGAVAPSADGDDGTELFELMEQAGELSEMDLDAFWEEATADAGNADMDGLSFEEAVQRGLLPPELL